MQYMLFDKKQRHQCSPRPSGCDQTNHVRIAKDKRLKHGYPMDPNIKYGVPKVLWFTNSDSVISLFHDVAGEHVAFQIIIGLPPEKMPSSKCVCHCLSEHMVIAYSILYIMSIMFGFATPFLTICLFVLHEAHNASLRADAQRELQSVMQTVSGNLNSKEQGMGSLANPQDLFNGMNHDVYEATWFCGILWMSLDSYSCGFGFVWFIMEYISP